MVVEIDHPKAGRLCSIGDAVKTSPVDEQSFKPAPLRGQHTNEVLRDILGYSPQRIATLRRAGIIARIAVRLVLLDGEMPYCAPMRGERPSTFPRDCSITPCGRRSRAQGPRLQASRIGSKLRTGG